MSKTYAGARLRRLREERRMTQADLARVLAISPSYLNQMEHDSRPLTVPVLLRLTEAFGVDPGFFSERDTSRLVADLREALAKEVAEARVSPPTWPNWPPGCLPSPRSCWTWAGAASSWPSASPTPPTAGTR